MFGTYLIKALHDVTEGLDCWGWALRGCIELVKALEEEEPALNKFHYWLIYLCNILQHRSRLDDLGTTLACSANLRRYFRNSSVDENAPVLEFVGNKRLPKDNKEEASLISLLRALREKDVDSAISLESDTWADEIVTLCRRNETTQQTWVTNFALEKAEESRYAIGAFAAVKRFWDRENLAQLYDPEKCKAWQKYSEASDRLRALDPTDTAFNSIVKKHMTPDANLKFAYVGSTSSPQPQNSHGCGWLVYKTRRVSSSATGDPQHLMYT